MVAGSSGDGKAGNHSHVKVVTVYCNSGRQPQADCVALPQKSRRNRRTLLGLELGIRSHKKFAVGVSIVIKLGVDCFNLLSDRRWGHLLDRSYFAVELYGHPPSNLPVPAKSISAVASCR